MAKRTYNVGIRASATRVEKVQASSPEEAVDIALARAGDRSPAAFLIDFNGDENDHVGWVVDTKTDETVAWQTCVGTCEDGEHELGCPLYYGDDDDERGW